jgi:hypothetical protein
MYQINGQSVRIEWGDKISYKRASVAPAYRNEAEDQTEAGGPYEAVCVSTEDWGVQVRADGWMGAAPLYNVYTFDILAVTPRK